MLARARLYRLVDIGLPTLLAVTLVVLLSWPLVLLVTSLLVPFWAQFVPMAAAVFSVARYGGGRAPAYGALAEE